MRDVEHTVDVTAETLYEAVGAALAALEQDSWVGEIAQGLNTVSVLVQQPPVKHEVKIKGFLSWLGRPGGSPRMSRSEAEYRICWRSRKDEVSGTDWA